METNLNTQFAFPSELITAHREIPIPGDFGTSVGERLDMKQFHIGAHPVLYTAHLPKILDWLHRLEQPSPLEKDPCEIPVLLYDSALSFDRLLFHYDGSPASAKIIKHFLYLFSDNLQDSKATIISPAFIPKSKLKEEQEIIHEVTNCTSETSFIKFNFNRIGDFWSYAVKHQVTVLVTTKNNQADLAKVLFHFYKGGLWYEKLSFYMAL